MAEGKKSFLAYADWKEMFDALPDEFAGKLIKHIFSYVNDENPSTDDFVINALFSQIKTTLKRDLVKWEDKKTQRSEAGKASAEARRIKKEREATEINDRSNSLNEPSTKSTVNCKLLDVTTNVVDKGDYGKKVLDGSYSEDPVYQSKLTSNIETLKTFDEWKNTTAMSNGIKTKEIPIWLDKFLIHIQTQGKIDVSVNELKKHFTSWLRIRLKAGDKLPSIMTPEEKRNARSQRFMTN
ncbi:DUF6291 domain-containing protein [Sphingobacterium sp. 1.A.4]|uniref:DUF6291 domain-containing protein n=1 Tax=Sphingobacterium sp. 1.A.4 TaxID=2044603 RepID=UPI000C0C0343|nr:DUF6291 domain-containing protein [Sphingobacterium sp. 1.A.4]